MFLPFDVVALWDRVVGYGVVFGHHQLLEPHACYPA